ncbi:Threonine/homoserine/homoserine lactone efflux protein [Desulfuromusa kysingii]|uniref:Threonine/homoserine/homoserine lactone efflux protein n=1 Tax=Desulfuromusa kysingii TaxID=37625 RepID=A0A1H3W9K5_9BACT|nr:LysE family translocator [Desulfuromusa kysingii]SDZ83766.1 Threonine/homoserine/homoserine lactone efflux protein [Desulfuromusa kysingii]
MIDQFWTFFIAITLLTLFPGVDSLLVVRNSSRGGWKDGIATSTGICSGLFVHATVSALGISALLLQSAIAFNLLKLIGGGYLLWLGSCSLWNALHRKEVTFSAVQPAVPRIFLWSRSLREGFVCNVFNPKTLLFYMAFLPQFIDPSRSPIVQSLFMAAVHFCIAMVYQGGLAILACRISDWFKGSSTGRLLEGLAGVILVSFGLRIFLERRI